MCSEIKLKKKSVPGSSTVGVRSFAPGFRLGTTGIFGQKCFCLTKGFSPQSLVPLLGFLPFFPL